MSGQEELDGEMPLREMSGFWVHLSSPSISVMGRFERNGLGVKAGRQTNQQVEWKARCDRFPKGKFCDLGGVDSRLVGEGRRI